MNSTRQPSKRAGRKLSPEDVDNDKKVKDHLRSEKRKDHINIITIIACYGAIIAIPVLYFAFLYVNRGSPGELSKDIWSGLTAVVGFVFGNLLKGLNDGK